MVDVVSLTDGYALVAAVMWIAHIVVPRVTALAALATTLRGSHGTDRALLLARYADCLPYWCAAYSGPVPAQGRRRTA
ncbi:hypothetical protein Vau01_064510 [Virgisporangium aurantiacum]|uniref:Uncharacterized protein n=1 Tax=Virgisporangium aurantiacum TaxID=175570 RepID=A0A8J3ZC06_9ACTN|nr:hypothetical protein Vau01_064510 [Virgisporangium aurantiacum]